MTDIELLRTAGHRKVKVLASEAHAESAEAQALFRLAMGDKQHWTLSEWREVLRQLDSCRDTVDDWLALRV